MTELSRIKEIAEKRKARVQQLGLDRSIVDFYYGELGADEWHVWFESGVMGQEWIDQVKAICGIRSITTHTVEIDGAEYDCTHFELANVSYDIASTPKSTWPNVEGLRFGRLHLRVNDQAVLELRLKLDADDLNGVPSAFEIESFTDGDWVHGFLSFLDNAQKFHRRLEEIEKDKAEAEQIEKLKKRFNISDEELTSTPPISTLQTPVQAVVETKESTLPTQTAAAIAGPWRRLLARIFDLYLYYMVLGVVGELTVAKYSSAYINLVNNSDYDKLYNLMLLPVAMLLDAVVCSIFGTSPAKFILGIKVEKLNKEKLSALEWFNRSFKVWLFGLAAGLPLISFFTMWREYKNVSQGLPTSYDQASNVIVLGENFSKLRWVASALITVVFFGLVGYLISTAMQSDAQKSTAQKSPPYSWQNPVTKRTVSVDAIWKFDDKSADLKAPTYLFLEINERAFIILGMESYPGSINNYVRAFVQSNKTKMEFTDGGRYANLGGVETWIGTGEFVDVPGSRLKVEIRKEGSLYWRTVSLQEKPYDYSDAMILKLYNQLWQSTGITIQTTPSKISQSTHHAKPIG